jgi:hypothetical protein
LTAANRQKSLFVSVDVEAQSTAQKECRPEEIILRCLPTILTIGQA